jgi:hypothetical protein
VPADGAGNHGRGDPQAQPSAVRPARKRPWELLATWQNLILALLFALSAIGGWLLGPAAAGAVPIPAAPAVTVTQMSKLPIELVATLGQQSHDKTTVLTLAADLPIGSATDYRPISWDFDITHLSSFYRCSYNSVPGMEQRHQLATRDTDDISGTSYGIFGTIYPSQVFADVRVCWRHSSPIATNGPYLSAALPAVAFTPPHPGSITRRLALPGTGLSAYTQQGGIAPTVISAGTWSWTSSPSVNATSVTTSGIPISAASITGLQSEARNLFLAGILLGIAGGLFVTFVTSLASRLDSTRKHQKDNHAAAATDHA